ncbi:MAG: hypothetical protein ACOC4B_02620, partial [Bacteroidota bacterium]
MIISKLLKTISLSAIPFITGCINQNIKSDEEPKNQQTHDKKNVLFIIVDDLRPELNCYNAEHIKSPNIDKLAAQGNVFN